ASLPFRPWMPCPLAVRPRLRLGGRRRLPDRRVEVGLRRLGELRAELVAKHLAADLAHLAGSEIADLERPVGDADEAVGVEADMAEQPLHLAVLAFAKPQRQPDVA